MSRQLTLLADTRPQVMEKISLPDGGSEAENLSLPYGGSEAKKAAIMRYLERDKSEGTRGNVNKYRVPRSRNYYYRYSYKLNGKSIHRHIPGGNVLSSLANKRADKVRNAIARRVSPPDILQMIAGFSRGEN